MRFSVYLYILCFSLDVLAESLLDERYVGEMHSPVLISAEGKSVVAFFLKNNLKGKIKEYVADGEIYSFNEDIPSLNDIFINLTTTLK